MQKNEPLEARLVLNRENAGWILEKFAVRLAENLPHWNITADISDKPSDHCPINHYLLYLYVEKTSGDANTMLVTHIDTPGKLAIIKENLDKINLGICLSQATSQFLVSHGISGKRLCYITPAHDGLMRPRRINIGITSRIYGDGRKREFLLTALADRMRLDAFNFEIIGEGWESIIDQLVKAGATVNYFAGTGDYAKDYEYIKGKIPQFDYYLYTGMDEGSMGYLDALSAGVKTIVTPQGFHLDIDNGITHSFETLDDLVGVFSSIQKDLQDRVKSVQSLSWDHYAFQHNIVWRELLKKKETNINVLLHGREHSLTSISLGERVKTDLRLYRGALVRRFNRLNKYRK